MCCKPEPREGTNICVCDKIDSEIGQRTERVED